MDFNRPSGDPLYASQEFVQNATLLPPVSELTQSQLMPPPAHPVLPRIVLPHTTHPSLSQLRSVQHRPVQPRPRRLSKGKGPVTVEEFHRLPPRVAVPLFGSSENVQQMLWSPQPPQATGNSFSGEVPEEPQQYNELQYRGYPYRSSTSPDIDHAFWSSSSGSSSSSSRSSSSSPSPWVGDDVFLSASLSPSPSWPSMSVQSMQQHPTRSSPIPPASLPHTPTRTSSPSILSEQLKSKKVQVAVGSPNKTVTKQKDAVSSKGKVVPHIWTGEQLQWLVDRLKDPMIAGILQGEKEGTHRDTPKARTHRELVAGFNFTHATSLVERQIKNKIDTMRASFKAGYKLENTSGQGDTLTTKWKAEVLKVCSFYYDLKDLWLSTWGRTPSRPADSFSNIDGDTIDRPPLVRDGEDSDGVEEVEEPEPVVPPPSDETASTAARTTRKRPNAITELAELSRRTLDQGAIESDLAVRRLAMEERRLEMEDEEAQRKHQRFMAEMDVEKAKATKSDGQGGPPGNTELVAILKCLLASVTSLTERQHERSG